MPDSTSPWDLALDQPGSANDATLRGALTLTALIAVSALIVIYFGNIQLEPFPQFSIFHAGFVFLADGLTCFVLFGQFGYRLRPSYAILACAYLFNALMMIPFLLSFPGALKAAGGVIGGPQSSVWIWHLWHIGFPALTSLALIADKAFGEVPNQRAARMIGASIACAMVLGLAASVAVTLFHDSLPLLLSTQERPATSNFYLLGGIAATVTTVAMLLAWRHALRNRSILHLWLAVTLAAFLADIAASLMANPRFSGSWYFGRIESMLAGGILLIVLLGEVNRLYRHLASSMTELSFANTKLTTLLTEKDALVDELRLSEQQIRQLAYYDTLTNLPNRRLLLDRMSHALSQAKRLQHPMAVMFLDLDRFKEVNDSLGHEVGDELLRQTAERLTACVRGDDTISRSGGDEFIIVLPLVSHADDARQVAEKILHALDKPFVIKDHELQVSASIGIAISPQDGQDDMQELMRKADEAMYEAKKSGRHAYSFFDAPKSPC